jgi:opacity protein-like surface antigen
MIRLAAILLVATCLAPAAFAQTATPEELEKKIQALQAEIANLKASGTSSDRLSELERRIDLLAAELEKSRTGGATEVEAPAKGESGLGPAASKVYRRAKGVSIGGYGEVLYTRPSSTRQDGLASGGEPRIDLLRYVAYLGYKWSDKILLNSEIEFEHATTGEGEEERGEASVEFAYVEFRPWKNVGFRAGELLLPLGFLNELHEPPIFHGARRNEVETQILPSTWPENGIGAFGQTGAFEWRAYVVAGLDSAGFTAEGIREGRQEGSQSRARDVAFTARVDYSGTPGVSIGASVFTGDSGQGAVVGARTLGGRVTLFDLHGQYQRRGLQLRALYARSTIDDVTLIDQQNGLLEEGSVGERQYGFYVEGAYDLAALRSSGQWSVMPFVRYEKLNPQDRVPAGLSRDPTLDQKVWTAGVGVKPVPNVVLKADYQWLSNRGKTGTNQFNLAVGYLF